MEKVSLYKSIKSTNPEQILVNDYISDIRRGTWQDFVIEARVLKQQGDIAGYKAKKLQAPCFTGSAIMNAGEKNTSNILSLNGYILIDIDCAIDNISLERLKNDKYSSILHRSFGGDGVVIFVKIDHLKFIESFEGLAQHYYSNYDIVIDASCKNTNRLRFISYDPDIFVNEKASRFIAKAKPKKEIKIKEYVYVQSDFKDILRQISERNIDLCQEDYFRYIRVGFAIADKFGIAGEDVFHQVCQYGAKYDYKKATVDYANFCKSGNSGVRINTFYYYCKEAGIELYSKETQQIITSVKIAKSQGCATLEEQKKHLKTVHDIDLTSEQETLINTLISSNYDYSDGVNEAKTQLDELKEFILQAYEPKFNTLTHDILLRGQKVEDKHENDILLEAHRVINEKIKISDIRSVLNSSAIPTIDPIKDFFLSNNSIDDTIIDRYSNCLLPKSDYNNWAFKKWIVGAVHNWIANENDPIVCPLTLVLSGDKQGIGKTSFIRNLLPNELKEYYAESRIDGSDKDSLILMSKKLIILDDEFGGKAFKDSKDYKALSDKNFIDCRQAYTKNSKSFKRRAILAGTTNEKDILKDVTGNRRILAINVDSIDYNTMIAIDKTQLWASAYNLLKNGFDWSVRTEADIEYLRKNTMENEMVRPIEEMFFKYYSFEETEQFSEKCVVNQGEILEYLCSVLMNKPTKYDIKEIFDKHKITYKVYKLSSNTIKKGFKLWIKPINQ
jgi:predicted P-loop ATPase